MISLLCTSPAGAQIFNVSYELTYGALPLSNVAGSDLITNGSFETHANFDAWFASASAADKLLMRGPKNSQDPNSYVGLRAARYGNWANTIGHVGLPNGWKTFSNGAGANEVSGGTVLLPGVNQPGTYTVSGTPNGLPTGTITNPDLHARWTRFDTDGQGQVSSLPRPNFLGKSSMYFGTGATMYGTDGNDPDSLPDTFVGSFGTPGSNGAFAINPTSGSPGGLNATLAADTSFVNSGRLMTGYGATAAVAPSGNITWARNSPVTATSLYQDLTGLTTGDLYRLSFWAATENSETPAAGYNVDPGMFKVTIAGVSGQTETSPQQIFLENPGTTDPNRGRFYFIIFSATSSNMRIRFDDYGHLDTTPTDNAFGSDSRAELVLDGVELRAVPEAKTWGTLIFLAAAGLWSGFRRRQFAPK